MDHVNIPEDVYKALFEGLGIAEENVETKGKKPAKVNESAEQEAEEVNEAEEDETHFCPVCEAELPDEFDDDVLMERLSEIYEQLETLNEAIAEDSEDEDESEDEDSDEDSTDEDEE